MSNLRLHSFLYQFRLSFSVALLLIILYFVLFSWAIMPPIVLSLSWQADTILTSANVVKDEYRQYIHPGDIVLAIDDHPIERGAPVFTTPIKTSYKFTIQRGNEVITQHIPVGKDRFLHNWILSHAILALAFWFVGLLTVTFVRSEQSVPLYVGMGFQLIGAGIVSPGPAQLGAPGGWIVANVLIFYFPLIALYLGYFPRQTQLSNSTTKMLRMSFFILTSLAIVGAIEVVFLFPEQSLRDVIGVSSTMILTILTGASIVAAIAILFIRLIRSPYKSYERQQLSILFTFLILALSPLFFFVILPVDQVIFVPYPFVYSLLLLAPVGYFFVLHRQGHLELDPLFSRIITIIVLILALGMANITGVYLLESIFQVDFSDIGQGAFVFILFGVAISSHKRMQSWIDLLLYGRNPLDNDSIQIVKTKLAAYPEASTVNEIVKQIADNVQVEQIAVLAKENDKEQYVMLAGNRPVVSIPNSEAYQKVCLRSKSPDTMGQLPEWVELSLPIKARGDILGLFLLSRPINGYFNAQQVDMLQEVAETLAFGILVIGLVEAMNQITQQSLFEREVQRQRIATEIHNEPLHALTTVLMQAQRQPSAETVRDMRQTVRQATQDLRRIISGLRPPILMDSVEWIVRQLVREFAEAHENIHVTLHPPEIQSTQQATEETKLPLYYILTETLNNISRHAKATEVEISLHYDDEILFLNVWDNGIGTDVGTRPLTELLRRHHMGVADMHRWASIGQGTLEITENIPSGTIVRLTLPTRGQPN